MAGVCEGECMGCSPGEESLICRDATVVSFHGYMEPLKGGSRSWPSLQLKGIKGKIFFVLL